MTGVPFLERSGASFLSATASKPALGPTLAIETVPGTLTPGESGRGVKFITNNHLEPKLKTLGAGFNA